MKLFRAIAVVSLCAALLAPTRAEADDLDVRKWLSRPGVRMLAVEFYATWCKPCMEAVPHWKKLHERYADQGLRLVVVSTRDPKGQCINPGWNPDDIVCDPDGRIADAMNVGNALPAAFLWSWRGNLLVRRGHVDEVTQAIQREIKQLPRVTLAPPVGMDKATLQGLQGQLRAELLRSDKLTVVAGAEEDEMLEKIRRSSHDFKYREASRCKLGETLAANSLLRTALTQVGDRQQLHLQLYSAQKGCLTSAASARWNPQRPHISVAEAVSELVDNLRIPVQMPGRVHTIRPQRRVKKVEEKDLREQAESWDMPDDQKVIVTFTSKPSGAVVQMDGRMICQDTSKACRRLVAPGRHQVVMEKEEYLQRKGLIIVDEATSVDWALDPDFGWLTVQSTPSGLPVRINGKAVGNTPIDRRRFPPGAYKVMVVDDRHYKAGRQVQLSREEHERITVNPQPRLGGVAIEGVDSQGNAAQSAVWIDGKEVGTTPYRAKILIGSHEVELRHETYGLARKTIVVQEKTITTVQLTMDRNLSVRLRARDAMKDNKLPARCRKIGPVWHPFMFTLFDNYFPPLVIGFLSGYAGKSPGGNDGIWTNYFITKALLYGVVGTGIYLAVTNRDDKASVGFIGGISAVIAAGPIGQGVANYVFLRKIKDRYVEACVMKHLGGKTSCAPAQEEPSGLTLAPFIAPGPDGDAHWGVSMGGGF